MTKNSSLKEKFYNDMETLKLEKMRYNNNSLSYKLGLLGIVFSLAAMFFGLNSINPTGISTVVAILINILVFLFGFLCAEKVKVYQKKYSYIMLGLAGICFARIFWYPIILFTQYSKFTSLLDGTRTGYDAASLAASRLGASIKGDFITESIDGSIIYGHHEPNGYLTGNGYVRGALIIVFLACAVAAFVSSALINIKKSNDLENYLKSQNEKN